MNTETLNALKQVNALITQLEDSLNDPTLTPQERSLIEQAINDQSDLQDTLIQQSMQAMVDRINADNQDMQQLITEMEKTSEKLAKLVGAIKVVSNVIGILAEITAKALSAGLL